MLQRLRRERSGTLDCDLNFSNGDRSFTSAACTAFRKLTFAGLHNSLLRMTYGPQVAT